MFQGLSFLTIGIELIKNEADDFLKKDIHVSFSTLGWGEMYTGGKASKGRYSWKWREYTHVCYAKKDWPTTAWTKVELWFEWNIILCRDTIWCDYLTLNELH